MQILTKFEAKQIRGKGWTVVFVVGSKKTGRKEFSTDFPNTYTLSQAQMAADNANKDFSNGALFPTYIKSDLSIKRNPIGALRKSETEGINMPLQSVWESKLTDALFLAITAPDAKSANAAIDLANFFSKNIKSKTAIARAKKNALLRADRKVNFNVNKK